MITLEKYKELKERGWKKLSATEREEYSEGLKHYGQNIVQAHINQTLQIPTATLAEETGVVDPKGKHDDTLVIKRSELDAMFKQMTEERDAARQITGGEDELNTWKKKKDEGPIIRTARMRRYQKDSDSPVGLIVGFKHHKWDRDERTLEMNKDIYKLTVMYEDRQEEVELPYGELAKMENFETVKIMKLDKEDKEMIQGYVNRPQTRNGYTMRGERYPANGELVPLTVTSADYTAHIVRENGQKLTIDAKYLNT